jgi:hypothetical protein
VSNPISWTQSGCDYRFPFLQNRIASLLRCSTAHGAEVRWTIEPTGVNVHTPRSDTLEHLLRVWHLGHCQPEIVADAIEETLADQDSLDKAQWLLLLLRGDPSWSDSITGQRLVINRPPVSVMHIAQQPYHAPYPSSAEEFITTSHTMPSDSCAGGCEVLPIGDNFLTEVLPRAIRDRYRQHASTATELALVVNEAKRRQVDMLLSRDYARLPEHMQRDLFFLGTVNGVRIVTMPSVPNNAALLLPLSRVRHLLTPEGQR